MINYFTCAAAGYLVGTINPSYILSKIRGFDIRQRGSGNAGASNALIVLGKLAGVICAIFDIAKAALVILLMKRLFPKMICAFAVTGAACILGHIFPFYMRFRGGKGLACLAGMILAFDWRVFLIMLCYAVVLALVTNYICFVPMTASVVFPFVYGFLRHDWIGVLLLGVVAVVILCKHRENIRRIRMGTEMRLSYLWNKEKEVQRLKVNYHQN